MIYFTFIGSHDKIAAEKPFGAALTIFFRYKAEIDKVYIFTTTVETASVQYSAIANQTKDIIRKERSDIEVFIVNLAIDNPIDYEIVYPVMLHEIENILEKEGNKAAEKIINITSGTPTMTACWLLLHKAGLIPNSKIIQSFEAKYARKYGSSTRVVNLEIDDFPQIKAPESIKRNLTIIKRENIQLRQRLKKRELDEKIPELIGSSGGIRSVKEQIIEDLDDKTNVLIVGERGSGKQIIANAIWKLYHKEEDVRLTTFDCGTIAPNLLVSELFGYKKGAFTGAEKDYDGILKKCDGKMLFLDEIGNLPLDGQQALLRYLQNGELRAVGSNEVLKVNTQVIAATNKDINDENIFAQDLKDRFDDIVFLPALKERKEDIPELIEYFLKWNSDKPVEIKDDLMDALLRYAWPGNVRELEKWIKKILRRFPDGGVISIKDIPGRMINTILNDEPENDYYLLPDLPLAVSLDEYVEKIREKARKMSSGSMAEVDRLLKQRLGTEKQRQWREKKRKKG
jgi:transcriptional regulator with AAA-type ATPase domain